MTARTPGASVGAPGKPSGDEWWGWALAGPAEGRALDAIR